MGLFSNKISRTKLKPGDHIYSWRTAYIYGHHGIYEGDGKVIHFTRGGGRQTETGTFLDRIIVSSSVNIPPCIICRGRPSSDGVISTCLDCFLAGGNLYLFEYNVSWSYFLSKYQGTCTLARSDPPEEVLSRATFLLRQNRFGVYNILKNNCEGFAIYCKSGLVDCAIRGLAMSGQANLLTATSVAAVTAVLGGLPLAFTTFSIGRLLLDIGMPRPTVIKVPVDMLHIALDIANDSVRHGRYMLLSDSESS